MFWQNSENLPYKKPLVLTHEGPISVLIATFPMLFCAFTTLFATWMVVVVVCLVDGSYYSFRLGFLAGIGVCSIPM
jgi:hypothetical protein